MEDFHSEDTFNYTYSSARREELRRIRRLYMPAEETKYEQVKRLNAKATEKATLYAIMAGFIGSLMLGIGMCCCMLWRDRFFFIGLAVGIPGIAIMSAAYPVFNRALKKEREKIAPEIIRLTDELLK